MRKILWIIVYSGALGYLLGCSGRDHKAGHKNEDIGKSVQVYTCSMHTQIIRHQPGNCPICGMALVKKENSSRELDSVDLDGLLQPANTYVVSQVPVTTLRNGRQEMILNLLGRVDYDTRRVNTISARFSGRIERLYVRYRFQHLHAGARIMDIYSPELLTAQENLLFVLQSDASNMSLVQAAKQRLLLLGMGSRELDQVIRTGKIMYAVPVYSAYTGHIHEAGEMGKGPGIEDGKMDAAQVTEELQVKEGMYVEKGQALFKVYNTDMSWIMLDIYPDQASLIKVGTAVEITPETAPDKALQGKISFLEPVYRSGSKTVTARVNFDNSILGIPVGSQVKAVIRLTDSEHDWLPNSAVLSLGLQQAVLVKDGDGFRVKMVNAGISANGEVQILKGLGPEDSVAVNAQYLMDSESFIKTKE